MKKVIIIILISMILSLFSLSQEWDTPRQLTFLDINNLRGFVDSSDELFLFFEKSSEKGYEIQVAKVNNSGELLSEEPQTILESENPQYGTVVAKNNDGNIIVVWKEYIYRSIVVKSAILNNNLELVSSITILHTMEIEDQIGTKELLNYDIDISYEENYFYIASLTRNEVILTKLNNQGEELWQTTIGTSLNTYSLELEKDYEGGLYIVYNQRYLQRVSQDNIIYPINDQFSEFGGNLQIISDSLVTIGGNIYDFDNNILLSADNALVDGQSRIYLLNQGVEDDPSEITIYNSDLVEIASFEENVFIYNFKDFENGIYSPEAYINNEELHLFTEDLEVVFATENFFFDYDLRIDFNVYDMENQQFNHFRVYEEQFREKFLDYNTYSYNNESFVISKRNSKNEVFFTTYDLEGNIESNTNNFQYDNNTYDFLNFDNITVNFNNTNTYDDDSIINIYDDGELIHTLHMYYKNMYYRSENYLHLLVKESDISGAVSILSISRTGEIIESDDVPIIGNNNSIKFDYPYIIFEYRITKLSENLVNFDFINTIEGHLTKRISTENFMIQRNTNGDFTDIKIFDPNGEEIVEGFAYCSIGEAFLDDDYFTAFASIDGEFFCKTYDYELNEINSVAIPDVSSFNKFVIGDRIVLIRPNENDESFEIISFLNGELDSHRFFETGIDSNIAGLSNFSFKIAGNKILAYVMSQKANLDFARYYHNSMYDVYGILYDIEELTDIEEIPTSEKFYARNYPNPLSLGNSRNAQTTIEFNLPQTQNVDVSIYNIKGQKVKNLLKDDLREGTHSVSWNGENSNNEKVASGVYFYKVKTDRDTTTKKLLILK